MDGSRLLQKIQRPSLLAHAIPNSVNVQCLGILGAKANNHGLTLSNDFKLRNSGKTFVHFYDSVHNSLGVLHVSLFAQSHHTGPALRNQTRAATARNSRGGVQATRPLGAGEILLMSKVNIPVEHNAGSLQGISELVGIDRHGGHTRQIEIKIRDIVSHLLCKRKNESTQTHVNMKSNVVLDSQLTQARDVIDDALRKGGCGAINHDGVGADNALDFRHIQLEGDGVHGQLDEADSKDIACLVNSGMR
mmetsp:Transcript_963/g.1667  ORF Transcript_963/g.1667 Transcript_963/m.1667 type:complete len:248 (-) Transcript_963:91-834(-)